jgi:DNA-binding NarL/FixJ family response regulator
MVADDHAVVRQGLRALIAGEDGLEVVAEAASAEEAVQEAVRHEADVAILDMRMPGGGVDACRRLIALRPATKVLVLSSYDDDLDVREVLDAGAAGYVLKDAPPEALLHAVEAVAEGSSVLDPRIARRLFHPSAAGDAVVLSEREREVLGWMARGLKNRDIAKAMWLSESTVKTHVGNVIQKLGVEDRTQAVVEALRGGMVALEN